MSDSEYLTPDEFAALPSDAHHAVWKAVTEHRIAFIPVTAGQPNGSRRFHREQVAALLKPEAET